MSHFLYCVLDRMVPQKALQCSCYCRREVLYMEESFEQVQEIKAASCAAQSTITTLVCFASLFAVTDCLKKTSCYWCNALTINSWLVVALQGLGFMYCTHALCGFKITTVYLKPLRKSGGFLTQQPRLVVFIRAWFSRHVHCCSR